MNFHQEGGLLGVTGGGVPRTMRRMRNERMELPRCAGIDPDSDTHGYFCRTCGGELIERGKWYVHGTQWVHPELWLPAPENAPQERLGSSSTAAIAAGHGMVHPRTEECETFGCEPLAENAPQEERS